MHLQAHRDLLLMVIREEVGLIAGQIESQMKILANLEQGALSPELGAHNPKLGARQAMTAARVNLMVLANRPVIWVRALLAP